MAATMRRSTNVNETILGTAIYPKRMIRVNEAIVAAQYKALDDARKKRARIRGRQSTILAGALGEGEPLGLNRKSLLGV